ncbi:hypothetical protein KI688_012134 [Linnemannia hyalina]|uniref:RFTS domain-containing protein n=1 Tax=Linnemannia hyalina TaxID=64524 RepID=A0A9P7XX52_9FUNG|nr:hypothetical protein KI688_012134 [Linnemannia hyalina]
MNHETKEVILKVTDVVKTVVHFGFIPFVIYLGMGEQEESAGYQQDEETFSWASDELLSSEEGKEGDEQENEAPSEGNAETTAINISAETAAATASLDAADIEMYKQLIDIPKTTTDLGDSGEWKPIRILDDFVIYNKNKSRPGYGFRFSDLEKCLDSYCEIGISEKVRPALTKHGRIFGRKKVQSAEAGTQGKGSTIHLSKVLGWGMEIVDNDESYLWVKTQFATYILGSPASMYGAVYDDLFKKPRLINLLMVALIAGRDVTLDNFMSNMRYTKAGACNRSPRRVLAGGPPVRSNWDQPLTQSDLMAHSAYVQEEIMLWWKQYSLPWEVSLTPPIFDELR